MGWWHLPKSCPLLQIRKKKGDQWMERLYRLAPGDHSICPCVLCTSSLCSEAGHFPTDRSPWRSLVLDATSKWKIRKKCGLHATHLPTTAPFSPKQSLKMVSQQNGEPLEKRRWCTCRHRRRGSARWLLKFVLQRQCRQRGREEKHRRLPCARKTGRWMLTGYDKLASGKEVSLPRKWCRGQNKV